jgi:CRP/FNR family cyclic AMP-dependent transcriptional regulator
MQGLDELIAHVPTFAGLAEDQLKLIAGCGRNRHIDAGEMLFNEGDPADHFFLIRRGLIALEVHAPGRGPLRIETLEHGEVVGWSWLFEPFRWQLDARVLEGSELIEFDAACLRGKVQADHELGYQLMSRFAANVVSRLQATRFQLLDVYGKSEVSA